MFVYLIEDNLVYPDYSDPLQTRMDLMIPTLPYLEQKNQSSSLKKCCPSAIDPIKVRSANPTFDVNSPSSQPSHFPNPFPNIFFFPFYI